MWVWLVRIPYFPSSKLYVQGTMCEEVENTFPVLFRYRLDPIIVFCCSLWFHEGYHAKILSVWVLILDMKQILSDQWVVGSLGEASRSLIGWVALGKFINHLTASVSSFVEWGQ